MRWGTGHNVNPLDNKLISSLLSATPDRLTTMEVSTRVFWVADVAEQIVEMIARHRVPEEILMDQGTNFTFQLLQELYRMLGMEAIRTVLYYSQTDGLVERFNQTLKHAT